MKKMMCGLLAAALLGLTACGQGKQAGPAGVLGDGSTGVISNEGTLELPSSRDEQAESAPEEYNEVHRASYDMYLRKYVVPYGSLKFYDKDWTNAADLGAERIFRFALQKNFNFYDSAMDYGAVFGDEFTYLQVPEAWFDKNYGCVYPQDIIENTAVEYFGLDAAFLRTAQAYLPAKNGYGSPLPTARPFAGADAYAAGGDELSAGADEAAAETDMSAMEALASSKAELMPAVTGVRRKGARAEITFTLSPCDPAGKLIEGDVLTKVMTIEDKEETFRYISVMGA